MQATLLANSEGVREDAWAAIRQRFQRYDSLVKQIPGLRQKIQLPLEKPCDYAFVLKIVGLRL